MKKQIILFTLLLVLLGGCNDADQKQLQNESLLKKGWKLTSHQVDGQVFDLSGIPLTELIYFTDQNLCYSAVPQDNNGTWEYKDSRTAWSYDSVEDILNIASHLPVTYYIETLIEDQLILYYYEYDKEGKLQLHEKKYVAAEVEVNDLKIRLK